ncbi:MULTISPECIES: hypothetical protein [Cohnella]|uniref:hypothetical protein n=1 Tax=Cohnella TaxID=329857 RepID=UPI0009B9D915|nr:MULTISPECIES: hypothetical protein [Cohnella]MBN2981752.1 hypothetical protein [Cohnella algarum]
MNRIPAPKSGGWWKLAAAAAIFYSVALWIVRFAVLGQEPTFVHAVRFLLLGSGLAALFSLGGWLGARKLWACASLGTIAGLVLMATASRNAIGWEDLAGLLLFMEAVSAGIVVGAVLDLAAILPRLRKRK